MLDLCFGLNQFAPRPPYRAPRRDILLSWDLHASKWPTIRAHDDLGTCLTPQATPWLKPFCTSHTVDDSKKRFASGRRLGVRIDAGLHLLSSCLLSHGRSPATFFAVPDCPSALQECLDSGRCGFYLRSDAYKPDLHLLWRDAPQTMAALCGAVPSLGYLPEAGGCAAALLVGIRRGDNS